jgi:hypothetical protein
MPRPKRKIYRDPRVRSSHATHYHDAEGVRTRRGGKRIPLRMPKTSAPDIPSFVCGALTASGQPCKRWACIQDSNLPKSPPRCNLHGGRRLYQRMNCGCGGYSHPHKWASPKCWARALRDDIRAKAVAPVEPPKLDWRGLPVGWKGEPVF